MVSGADLIKPDTKKGGVSVEVKTCPKCGEFRPTWQYKPRCKNCEICNSKRRKRDDGDARRKASWVHGLKKVGATPEMYERMFTEQNGLCAICVKPESNGRRLAMDHDHATGRIRGLLCRNCNMALGLLKDDVDRFVTAVGYLTA